MQSKQSANSLVINIIITYCYNVIFSSQDLVNQVYTLIKYIRMISPSNVVPTEGHWMYYVKPPNPSMSIGGADYHINLQYSSTKQLQSLLQASFCCTYLEKICLMITYILYVIY